MNSPARRRAVLWALLPILAVLNLLVWSGGAAWLREHGDDPDPGTAFSRPSDGWIELDAQDRAHAEAGLLPVQVVDHRSGAAVAGAPIWIERDATTAWRLIGTRSAAMPQRAPDMHADARGICWIALEEQFMAAVLAARPDGESRDCNARTLAMPAPHDVSTRAGALAAIIRLAPPLIRLQVQVRDRHGRKVEHAPVFLKNFIGENPVPMQPLEDGVTWVAHVLPDASDAPGMPETLGLRLGVGVEDGPSVPLRSEHFRGTPVEVDLAKCGGLEIHVADQHGRPQHSALPIRVMSRTRPARWQGAMFAVAPPLTADGVATISGVPLRQRWLVGAPLLEDDRYFFVEVDGPREEGEIIRVALDLGASSRMIQGRLATRDGRSLASTPVFAVLKPGVSLFGARFSFTTDADGRFSFLLPRLPGAAWERLHLDVSDDGRRLAASAEVSLTESGEADDLGLVVIESEDSRGVVRVVDREGRPLRGADAWVRPLDYADTGAPGPWLQPDAHSGTLAITERLVYGDPPYEVVLTHPTHLGAEGVLQREGDTLTLQMTPAARVRGRVLLPESADVAIEVLPARSGEPPWNVAADFEPTSVTSPLGFFDCGPYQPGIFDLELRVAGMLIARASGAELTAGSTLAPLEFQALDLRHCTPMRVQLAHAPSRVRHDDLMLQVEYADGRRESLTGRNLLLPPEAVRVQVDAEGCATVWLPVVAGTTFVTLELAAE